MAVETLNDLMEALGLVFGSFAVATGLVVAVWVGFGRAHHPDWGAPSILIALGLAIAMRLVRGELLSMAAILLAIAVPLLWVEGRKRNRTSRTSPGPDIRDGRIN